MSKIKNRKNKKPVKKSAVPPFDSKAAPLTKTMTVMAALKRPDGATVEEIAAATGWQKHSVRGFLSTQKKKRPDFILEKFTRGDGKTAYKLETELS